LVNGTNWCVCPVEIFVARLPALNRHSASADALIAAFERRLHVSRLRARSSCAGDYEDPDCTAHDDDGAEADSDARGDDDGEAPAAEGELST
jgi:hypothetical protein